MSKKVTHTDSTRDTGRPAVLKVLRAAPERQDPDTDATGPARTPAASARVPGRATKPTRKPWGSVRTVNPKKRQTQSGSPGSSLTKRSAGQSGAVTGSLTVARAGHLSRDRRTSVPGTISGIIPRRHCRQRHWQAAPLVADGPAEHSLAPPRPVAHARAAQRKASSPRGRGHSRRGSSRSRRPRRCAPGSAPRKNAPAVAAVSVRRVVLVAPVAVRVRRSPAASVRISPTVIARTPRASSAPAAVAAALIVASEAWALPWPR